MFTRILYRPNEECYLLITPGAIPLGLIPPRVSHSDERYLAGGVGSRDVHIFDSRDGVGVTFHQTLRRLHFQHARVRLKTEGFGLDFFFFFTELLLIHVL